MGKRKNAAIILVWTKSSPVAKDKSIKTALDIKNLKKKIKRKANTKNSKHSATVKVMQLWF